MKALSTYNNKTAYDISYHTKAYCDCLNTKMYVSVMLGKEYNLIQTLI